MLQKKKQILPDVYREGDAFYENSKIANSQKTKIAKFINKRSLFCYKHKEVYFERLQDSTGKLVNFVFNWLPSLPVGIHSHTTYPEILP